MIDMPQIGISVVSTIPPALLNLLSSLPKKGGAPTLDTRLISTPDAFRGLISSAQNCAKILSPYVDPSFASIISDAQVPIQILSAVSTGRPPRPNPVLEHMATARRNLNVRYLNERAEGLLAYQIHGKLIIVDDRTVYVGSANFTDVCLYYNLELGVVISDKGAVAIFQYLFDQLFAIAVSATAL